MISTGLMTNIESVDTSAGVVVCQVHSNSLYSYRYLVYIKIDSRLNHHVKAGVVLETLDSALAEQGMMVPLDLGAKVPIRNQN